MSETHRGHKAKFSHEMAPEVKDNLKVSLSDLKVKRNVLDENRSMLTQKVSELNIKVSF